MASLHPWVVAGMYINLACVAHRLRCYMHCMNAHVVIDRLQTKKAVYKPPRQLRQIN